MSLISSVGKVLTYFPHLKVRVNKLKIARYLLDKEFEAQYNYFANLDPSRYPAELARWYESITGTPLDLENPKTHSEKIQWLKLYDSTPLKTRLADKYLVRNWVAEKIGEEYLIPLLGVWDSFDGIDFDALPNQFVLKANHGSGWNIIVRDKATLNKVDAKIKFDKWMKLNFAYVAGLELHYRDIIPKIIAEKYLENANGELPDYKFHCYSGRVEHIQCMTGRANHNTQEIMYDYAWNPLPFVQSYPRHSKNFPKPPALERLIELAQTLSKGFCYVRVDFYVLDNGSIKFGEMTFTPGSGMRTWNPPEYNLQYGKLISLPR